MTSRRARRDDPDAAAVQEAALSSGHLEPLGRDRAACRRWRACDLASMVEGALGVQLDPDALDARATRSWLARLRRSYRPPPLHEDARWYGRPCWLLDEGRRVGTIGLGPALGGAWLPIHSLYVTPPARGRGVATRALRSLAALAEQHGLAGVRLGTHWTWQRSLRFYLARGFWVVSWKRDLQLVLEHGLPRYRFAIDGDAAHLEVERDGELTRALTARRDGDLLQVHEARWLRARSRFHLWCCAGGTFAVSLALAGWPLVRSEAHWARRHAWSDGGDPEGLAYKIGIFERLAVAARWVVDTPLIPGLDRWQAWERGEEHGRRAEASAAIRTVLAARGLRVDEAVRAHLEAIDDPWRFEALLRRAATASSVTEWWDEG